MDTIGLIALCYIHQLSIQYGYIHWYGGFKTSLWYVHVLLYCENRKCTRWGYMVFRVLLYCHFAFQKSVNLSIFVLTELGKCLLGVKVKPENHMCSSCTFSVLAIRLPLSPGAGTVQGDQRLVFEPPYQWIKAVSFDTSTTFATWGHSPLYFGTLSKHMSPSCSLGIWGSAPFGLFLPIMTWKMF